MRKVLRLHDSFRFVAPVIFGARPSPTANNGLRPITVLGKNFVNAPVVTVSGVPATSVWRLSDSLLTCLPPAGAVGVKNLVVTNPDGQHSGTSGNGLLEFVLWPHITSITPNTGTADGGTAITNLAGSGFVSGCTVTIGGAPAPSVVFVSSSQLTCVTPLRTIGAKDVVVTNPDGSTSGTAGNGLFTYTLPFDPTTLVLSSYQRDYTDADASSLTWLGTASAGISAQHKEGQLSAMPLATAPLNGFKGAGYTRASGRNTATRRVSDNGAVLMDPTLVTNTAYTASFFLDLMEARKGNATIYLNSSVFQADAHWGWMFKSTASLTTQVAITITASTRTIDRANGSWITDGFVTGQTVYIRRSVFNDGFVSTTLLSVSALTLTFNVGSNLVDEVSLFSDDIAISAGPYAFMVFNYTGSFPFVEVVTTPGLHWYYVRRTASGTIQIDIDGVAGTPTALVDHIGASGIGAQTNTSYGGAQCSFVLYERFTALVSQSTTERTDYKRYLNAKYGTAY